MAGSGVERTRDVWAGVAAMLVAVPSALGFGVTVFAVLGPEHAGAGALAGLVGAFALGLVAPLFGGSSHLISAPCGPAALLLSTLVASLLHDLTDPGPAKILTLLTLVGVLAAALQLAFGALGGGRLIKYIPYPVVSGYLSSIGVLLFIKQLPDFVGAPSAGSLAARLTHPAAWSVEALLVGAATVAGMLAGPRVTKRVPAVIVGIAAGAIVYTVLAVVEPGLRDVNPLVIGPIGATPSQAANALVGRLGGITSIGLHDLGLVLVPALTLAVLLSIDTLKTCVIVDALTRSRSDSNRVLRGQGLGNLITAALGGIPGAGTLGATMVNLNSGATSARSGVVEGASALVAVGLFGGLVPGVPGLVGWIPKAALAGIIMTVSARMIDRHSFALLRYRGTWPDFLVIVAVVVTAVLASPIEAAGVGLALAIVLFIRDQVRSSVVRSKLPGNRVSSKHRRSPPEVVALQTRAGEATVCRLQGNLFFGTTDQLLTLLEHDLAHCRYLVLDLKRVQSLDFTAAHMIEQMAEQLAERGARLLFSSLPASLPTHLDLRTYLNDLGLEQRERSVLFFASLEDAIKWVEDDILARAGIRPAPPGEALGPEDFELFRGLGPAARELLGRALEARTLAPGEAVFHCGDVGDELFLIRRGAVKIQLPLDGEHKLHVATFARGSFFGDLAFLDGGARSADAIAAEPTDVYALSRERFDHLAGSHPEVASLVFARLASILAARLRQTDAELQLVAEA